MMLSKSNFPTCIASAADVQEINRLECMLVRKPEVEYQPHGFDNDLRNVLHPDDRLNTLAYPNGICGTCRQNQDLCVWLLTRIVESITDAPNTLARLGCDKHYEVRQAVADNPFTPIATLIELSRDHHVDLRFAMAENHSVPVEILTLLCADDNPYVVARAQKTLVRLIEVQLLRPKFPSAQCAQPAKRVEAG
jgi:hypothetical protein